MFLRRKFTNQDVSGRAGDALVSDIVSNLTVLLRTRRGAGSFMEDFGTDVSSARTPAQLLLLAEEQIRANVERYEPRVVIVDVRELYDGDAAGLSVECRVIEGGKRIKIVASASGFHVEAVDDAPGAEW